MIPQPHNSLDDLTIIEVSIVIEWENVLLSELDRTFLMLKQLKKQILEVHSNYKYFKANNIAFRREVFLDYPFPKLPSGVTRGACRKLGETLHESNITLWTNTGAQANHPPPSDFEHFKMRALAHGRDKILGRKVFGLSFLGAIASLLFWVGKRIFINLVKIVSKNREVNLPIWQTPFAFGTMICFYLLSLVGGFISIFFPQYALKHWQI